MKHKIYNPFGVALFAIHDLIVVFVNFTDTIYMILFIGLCDISTFHHSFINQQIGLLFYDLDIKIAIGFE